MIVSVEVNTFYAWKSHAPFSVKLLGMGLSHSSQELRWIGVLCLQWLALVYHLFQFSSICAALVLLWRLGLCCWMSFLSISTPFSAMSCSCKLVPQLTASLHVLAPSPTVSCLLLCISIIFATGFSLSLFIQSHDYGGPVCLGFGEMVSVPALVSMTVQHCLTFVVHFDGSFLSFL